MKIRSKLLALLRKPLFYFFVFVFALGYVTPALADYLGPDRTKTVTTTSCDVILWECGFNTNKNIWKYNKSDSWSCASESKPWQAYPSNERTCGPANDGYQYWSREYTDNTSTQTFPPATISGTLQNCNLYNGWCNTAAYLGLSAVEPVSGYSITNIEGTNSGQPISCSAGANCNVTLKQGNNSLTYWAHSTFGDTTAAGSLTTNVDSVAPAISNTITGTIGTNGWYISPVSISADAFDATSGLASAQISVSGGPWQSSTSLGDGIFTLTSRATDNAGNVANVSSAVKIDTIAPNVTPIIPNADGLNGWIITGPAVVLATGSDSGSGLASALVSVDNGAWVPSSSLSDGTHLVRFRSVDYAGNLTMATRTVKVDRTGPMLSFSTIGTSGNAGWYISRTTTNVSSNDGGSGVDRVEFSQNKTAWEDGTSVISDDGINTIDAKVYDLAGNVSSGTITIKVDTVSPSLAVSPSGTLGNSGWYISQVDTSILTTDSGSGIDSIEYNQNSTGWTAGTSITSDDGINDIDIRVHDIAGNISTSSVQVKVDTVAPALIPVIPTPDGLNDWFVNAPVTVSVNGSDVPSGLDRAQLSVDGGPWQDNASLSDGSHIVSFMSMDVAGNTTTVVRTVKIDTVTPSLSTSVTGAVGASGWYTSQTITILTPTDNTSGVNRVEYNQNGEGWITGTSVISTDGINSIYFQVYDNAGNRSSYQLQVKVDTGLPSSKFIVPENGSDNVLIQGVYPMSGSSSDNLSGVEKVELSMDGGQTLIPLVVSSDDIWNYDFNTLGVPDGTYTIQVRTTDVAGNTDIVQTLGENTGAKVTVVVNNGPPHIKLTPEWFIWDKGSLTITYDYVPFKYGSLTILDPQNRWPKIEIPFGENYPTTVSWDRRFADGTIAPSGDYRVTVKACNTYNLCSSKTAIIKIPWISLIIPTVSPVAPTLVPEKPSAENIPEQSETQAPPVVVVEDSSPQIQTTNSVEGKSVGLAPSVVAFIALMWAVASAALSDKRPVAINAITKTIEQKQDF